MAQDEDPKIIHSPLSREVSEDGTTVRVEIYRLEHETEWALEVVDEFGGSTTWEDPFPSDKEALQEALACIAKDGIASFVVEDADGEDEEGSRTLH